MSTMNIFVLLSCTLFCMFNCALIFSRSYCYCTDWLLAPCCRLSAAVNWRSRSV